MPPPARGAATPVAKAAAKPAVVVESTSEPPVNKMRRRIVWASVAGFLTTCFLMFLRFFLPRSITRTVQHFRDRLSRRLCARRRYEVAAAISHLGDQDFGSAIRDLCASARTWVARRTGRPARTNSSVRATAAVTTAKAINFEGPAPRPMDRAHVELDAEGQIVVDIGRLYEWPKGGENRV